MSDAILAAEARVLTAWITFRKTHDLKDAKLSCCEHTKELFEALQSFEDSVRYQTAMGKKS